MELLGLEQMVVMVALVEVVEELLIQLLVDLVEAVL